MKVLAKITIKKFIYQSDVNLFAFHNQTWFWLWTGWTANKSNRTKTCFTCSTFRNHTFNIS